MTHLSTPSSAASAHEASAYSKPRILLHWLSAAVILWATLSGFGVALLDSNDPFRQWVELFNPQLTSLFIPFFAWRLWLAIKNRPQRTHRNAQDRLASAAHKAIYAAVSGVLITGVLMMSHPVMLLALVPLPQLSFESRAAGIARTASRPLHDFGGIGGAASGGGGDAPDARELSAGKDALASLPILRSKKTATITPDGSRLFSPAKPTQSPIN
ncbi:cytochrome b [Pseudomonas bohemica]|uniref:cytochrome b n=1 Tax=Pseudomonas bohemica TaxID=2044872 RepID=UPI001F48A6E3|nr:cytochrome b/b6 domain-containing protein [Pseudomonas bohemica]